MWHSGADLSPASTRVSIRTPVQKEKIPKLAPHGVVEVLAEGLHWSAACAQTVNATKGCFACFLFACWQEGASICCAALVPCADMTDSPLQAVRLSVGRAAPVTGLDHAGVETLEHLRLWQHQVPAASCQVHSHVVGAQR